MERKELPFVFKGVTDVTDCRTSLDVMKKAGLNWDVQKCPLVAEMPIPRGHNNYIDDGFNMNNKFYRKVEEEFGIYRTDNLMTLGTVKGRYSIVQNKDVFSFFDKSIGKNSAIWQTAGCYGNGERIFVSAKLPNYIVIDGDPVENYLLFISSHDGSAGVKIILTPIRVVCHNALNAAIASSTNFVSFKHTKSVHSNINRASELLGIVNNRIKNCDYLYQQMNKIVFDDKKSHEVFTSCILSNTELELLNKSEFTATDIVNKNWNAIEATNVSMKKVNTIAGINNYYHTGIEQKSILGTGWGVYNAVSGYYSNVDNIHGIKRMDSLILGDKARKIKVASDLILN